MRESNHPRIPITRRQLADFCRRRSIRELDIFGSALRDDFKPDSDLDVLVRFESDARVGFLELENIRLELEDLLGRPVDLVPKDGLKRAIRDDVLAAAEPLYHAA